MAPIAARSSDDASSETSRSRVSGSVEMQNAPSAWREAPSAVVYRYADPARRLLDRLDCGAERDVSDLRRQCPHDAIGAAHDLKHRRLHVDFGRQVLAQSRCEGDQRGAADC